MTERNILESAGNHWKPWNKDDIELLKKLFNEWLSIKDIAEKFWRTERSIAFKLYKYWLIDTHTFDDYSIPQKSWKENCIEAYNKQNDFKLAISPEDVCINTTNLEKPNKSYNILDDIELLSLSQRTENAFIKNNIKKIYKLLKPPLIDKILSEKIEEYQLEKSDISRSSIVYPWIWKKAFKEIDEKIIWATLLINYKTNMNEIQNSENNTNKIQNYEEDKQSNNTFLLEIFKKFNALLKSLDERSSKIVSYLFNFPLESEHITLNTLGSDLNITRERVRQIKENITKKINTYLDWFKNFDIDEINKQKDFIIISVYPYNDILWINQIYYVLNHISDYNVYYNNWEFILCKNELLNPFIKEMISNKSPQILYSELKQLEKKWENVSPLTEYIHIKYPNIGYDLFDWVKKLSDNEVEEILYELFNILKERSQKWRAYVKTIINVVTWKSKIWFSKWPNKKYLWCLIFLPESDIRSYIKDMAKKKWLHYRKITLYNWWISEFLYE